MKVDLEREVRVPVNHNIVLIQGWRYPAKQAVLGHSNGNNTGSFENIAKGLHYICRAYIISFVSSQIQGSWEGEVLHFSHQEKLPEDFQPGKSKKMGVCMCVWECELQVTEVS